MYNPLESWDEYQITVIGRHHVAHEMTQKFMSERPAHVTPALWDAHTETLNRLVGKLSWQIKDWEDRHPEKAE